MESEGRTRSGANRSSSRRGPRSDWRSSNQSGGTNSSANQYSSSDEECDVRNSGRGYRASQRTGKGVPAILEHYYNIIVPVYISAVLWFDVILREDSEKQVELSTFLRNVINFGVNLSELEVIFVIFPSVHNFNSVRFKLVLVCGNF